MNVWSASRTMLMALVVASCATGGEHSEKVAIVAPGSTQTDTRTASYEATLTAVVDVLEQKIGLPRVEVPLVLFPTRRAFEQGLVDVGYTKELARAASSFNAIGGARAVLVNASIVNGLTRTRRVRLIAHEVVHSVQYRLGGGTRGASEQWLREGFAEWVACRVTAHLGLASFDSLRDELVRQLGASQAGLRPAPFDKLATFPQWVEAQSRYDTPLYAQAFIATELLVEKHGVPAMIRYFESFRSTQDYERAFADAFGLDRPSFERLFMRRWQATVGQAGR